MKCNRCSNEAREGLKTCIQCAEKVKARTEAYRAANPEKIKAQMAAWYVANKEKANANAAAWYAANKGKVNARSKAWKAANPEKVKAGSDKYRAANAEKVKARAKAWYEANPERTKAKRLKNKYGITLEQYQSMLDAQDNRCKICLQPFTSARKPYNHHDHDIDKKRVVALLCRTCNVTEGYGKKMGDPVWWHYQMASFHAEAIGNGIQRALWAK